jgi:hypothetical protein
MVKYHCYEDFWAAGGMKPEDLTIVDGLLSVILFQEVKKGWNGKRCGIGF